MNVKMYKIIILIGLCILMVGCSGSYTQCLKDIAIDYCEDNNMSFKNVKINPIFEVESFDCLKERQIENYFYSSDDYNVCKNWRKA